MPLLYTSCILGPRDGMGYVAFFARTARGMFSFKFVPRSGVPETAGVMGKFLHCVGTACTLRTQRLGYSPK